MKPLRAHGRLLAPPIIQFNCKQLLTGQQALANNQMPNPNSHRFFFNIGQLLSKLLNLAKLASNLSLRLLIAAESNGYDNENDTASHRGPESTTTNHNDGCEQQTNGDFSKLFTEITNKQNQNDDDIDDVVLTPIGYLNDQNTFDVEERNEEYEQECLELYENASRQFVCLGVCRHCYLNALEQKLVVIEAILREGKENFALINRELCSRTQIEIFQGKKCIQGQQRRYVAKNSDYECRQQLKQLQQAAAQLDVNDFAYETLMPQSILQFNISKNINNPEWAQLSAFIERTENFPCHCNESTNYSSSRSSASDEYSNEEHVNTENTSTDEDQETIQRLAYEPPPSGNTIVQQIDQSNTSGEPEQHVRTSSTSTNLCIALSGSHRTVRSDVSDTFELAVEHGTNPKRKHYSFDKTTSVSTSSTFCCTTASNAKSTSHVLCNAIKAADSAQRVCDEAIAVFLPEYSLHFVLNSETTIKLNNNNNNNKSDNVRRAIDIELNCIPDVNRLTDLNLVENMPISRSSNIEIDSIRNSRNFLGKPSNILSKKSASTKSNDTRYEVKSAKDSTEHRTHPTYCLSKQTPDVRMPDLSKSSKPTNHPLLCSHSLCDAVGAGSVNRKEASGRISSGSGSIRGSVLDGQRAVDSASACNNLFPNETKSRRAYSADEEVVKVLPERTRLRRQRRLLAQNSDEAEDPIIRLNRLKARISGALTEVKGVLKQYTVDDAEAEDLQTTPNRPLSNLDSNQLLRAKSPHTETDTKTPVQFRFVKKTKRETLFYDNDTHPTAQQLSSPPQQPVNTSTLLTSPLTTKPDLRDYQEKYNLKHTVDAPGTPHNLTDIISSAQFVPTKASTPDHIRPNDQELPNFYSQCKPLDICDDNSRQVEVTESILSDQKDIGKLPPKSLDVVAVSDDRETPDKRMNELQDEFQEKTISEVAECEKESSNAEIKPQKQAKKEANRSDLTVKKKTEKKVTNKDKIKLKTETNIIHKEESKPEHYKDEEISKRTEIENRNNDKNECKKLELQTNDNKSESKVGETCSKPEEACMAKIKADSDGKKLETPKTDDKAKVKREEKLKKKTPADKSKQKAESLCESVPTTEDATKIQPKTHEPEKLINKEQGTQLKETTVSAVSPKVDAEIMKKLQSKECEQVKEHSKPKLKCEDKLDKANVKDKGKEYNKFTGQKKSNKSELKIEVKSTRRTEDTKIENKCLKDVDLRGDSAAACKSENKPQEEPQSNQTVVKVENEFQKPPSANCSQKDSKVNIKGPTKKLPSLSKEQNSGTNKMLTLTANNVTTNRRRASLAEMENTKIEPSIELCLSGAISRRPSDSGAILKTKISADKSKSTPEPASKLIDVTLKPAIKSKSKIHKPKDISPLDLTSNRTKNLILPSPNKEQAHQTATLDEVNATNKTTQQPASESRKLPHLPNNNTADVVSTDATSVPKPLIVIDELPLSSIVASPTATNTGSIQSIDHCPINEHKASVQNVSTAILSADAGADIVEKSGASHASFTADEFSESVAAATKTDDNVLVAASSNANSPKSSRQLAIETANDPNRGKSTGGTTSKAPPAPASPSASPSLSPTNRTANLANERPLSQFKQIEACADLSTAERTATSIEICDSNAKEFIQSTEIANSYNRDIQSDTSAGRTAASSLNNERNKMPEQQLIPPPVQKIDSITTVEHSIKSTSPTQQLFEDSSPTPEQIYQNLNAADSGENRPTETSQVADDLDQTGETNTIQTEASDLETGSADVTPKKERRIKKKVIINRQRRRLSATDYFFTSDFEDTASAISDTLVIPIAYVTDDEEEEAGPTSNTATHKPLKSCMKEREYHIGDEVLYAERFKKTQIRWKRGRVKDRICSISYLLDVDGKEISAHINYLKAFTKRKVNFSTKEYLDIKYEQLNQCGDNDDDDNEEQLSQDSDSNRPPKLPSKKQKYSIWNMV